MRHCGDGGSSATGAGLSGRKGGKQDGVSRDVHTDHRAGTGHFLSPRERSLRQRIDLFFAGLGQGVNAYRLRESRMARMRALNDMKDEELPRLGLRREQIPSFVFRDLFG